MLQLWEFQVAVDVDLKGTGLEQTVLDNSAHEKDKYAILHLVLLYRAPQIPDNCRHLSQSTKGLEEGLTCEQQDEEGDADVAY